MPLTERDTIRIRQFLQRLDSGLIEGMQAYVTYHDSNLAAKPSDPTGAGSTGGWHRLPTEASNWMSVKTSLKDTAGTWGTPIRVFGLQGTETAGVGMSDDIPKLSLITFIGDGSSKVGWTAGTVEYGGNSYAITVKAVGDGNADEHIYWDDADGQTSFKTTDTLATAIAIHHWKVCTNDGGKAIPAVSHRIILGGLIQAGSITASIVIIAKTVTDTLLSDGLNADIAQGIADAATAQAAADAAQADADTAQAAADAAQADADTNDALLDDIADDAKITPVEKLTIKPLWDAIVAEKSDIDSEADTFGVSKAAYGTAYDNLNTYLNTTLDVFDDMTATKAITRGSWDGYWEAYFNAKIEILNAISTAAKALADTAQSAADTAQAAADAGIADAATAQASADAAQADADTAQADADTAQAAAEAAQSDATTGIADAAAAQGELDEIAADTKVTPVEKLEAKQRWDAIVVEGTAGTGTIPVQATAFGVADTDFDTAYAALDLYLNTTITVFSNMATTTSMTRADWDTAWKNYYDERTQLLNAIATAAGALADTAQGAADTAQGAADTAQSAADTGIADAATAQAAAEAAQAAADAKIKTFYQDSVPTAENAGDIWYDTNDGLKMHRATAAGDDQVTAGEWEHVDLTIIDGGNITAATILAASIATYNLTAANATIENLMVKTAHIENLNVTTGKLENNAATRPGSAYTAGAIECADGVLTTIQTVASFVSKGGAISIWAAARSGPHLHQIRIYRDSTVIYEQPTGATYRNGYINWSIHISEIPGAGTYTYTLRVYVFPSDSHEDWAFRSVTVHELTK